MYNAIMFITLWYSQSYKSIHLCISWAQKSVEINVRDLKPCMLLAYWANVIGYCTSLLPGKIILSLPSLCASWVCRCHHFISMSQLDICMTLQGENKLTVKNLYNYDEIMFLWCHTARFLHSLCMTPILKYQLKNIIHSMTMSRASNKSSVFLLAFCNS
jgi:hypothetical protein